MTLSPLVTLARLLHALWVESASRASVQDRKSDESTTAWDESTTAEFFWDESGARWDESGAPAEQA